MKQVLRGLTWLIVIGLSALGSPALASEPEEIFVESEVVSFRAGGLPGGGEPYLKFIEAYELTSKSEKFGGLSSMRFFDGGQRVVMVTDRGKILTGKVETVRGKLALREMALSSMLTTKGRKLRGFERDAEAIALLDDKIWIGFERIDRIAGFGFDGEKTVGKSKLVASLIRKFRRGNEGIEGIDLLPGSSKSDPRFLIAIEGPDAVVDRELWVAERGVLWPFFVQASATYRPTDVTVLPDGSFLLLERLVSIASASVPAQIRFFPAANIKQGAKLAGKVIYRADHWGQFVNFEGMDLRKKQDGSWTLTLISDNNFSSWQETIWLDFAFDLNRLLSDVSK